MIWSICWIVVLICWTDLWLKTEVFLVFNTVREITEKWDMHWLRQRAAIMSQGDHKSPCRTWMTGLRGMQHILTMCFLRPLLGKKSWLGGSSHKTHWLISLSRRNNHCWQHYGLVNFLLTKEVEIIKCVPLLTYGKVSCPNEKQCYLQPHLQKIATG